MRWTSVAVAVLILVSMATAFDIELTCGWNLIGYGADGVEPISLWDLQVTCSRHDPNGIPETVNWYTATETRGWLSGVLTYYEPSTGYMIAGIRPGADSMYLEPGRGYWVMANFDCTLVVPGED